MKVFTHPLLIVVIVASSCAIAGPTAGLAFLGEPQPVLVAQAEPTPFQVQPPLLVPPAGPPANPTESEIIEADPERKQARSIRRDRLYRLEDFDRLDRAEQFDGVERFERTEPATVRPDLIVRPDPVRPESVERPATIERPQRVERQERGERQERVERSERVERRERIERPDRSGPRDGLRIERIERSGRRRD